MDTYDFIVTGAGSAGCAIARRLADGGQHRVLLLEAGPPDKNPWIHIPLGYAKTYVDPAVNWKFETEPQPQMENRRLYLPRGKTLGGSSSINGMVYIWMPASRPAFPPTPTSMAPNRKAVATTRPRPTTNAGGVRRKPICPIRQRT